MRLPSFVVSSFDAPSLKCRSPLGADFGERFDNGCHEPPKAIVPIANLVYPPTRVADLIQTRCLWSACPRSQWRAWQRGLPIPEPVLALLQHRKQLQLHWRYENLSQPVSLVAHWSRAAAVGRLTARPTTSPQLTQPTAGSSRCAARQCRCIRSGTSRSVLAPP